ncbi:MAG: hypothetical protein EZS28_009156 [Streblomastix strix]|uniref:Uncharacterized protein n=1 Tax=Streblomastix strix TaxID=222440 RepID=A0A5J4WLQ5_9EUKA|nr:MAG: hypothetical protein EZS28_009156 [Streblomastix strix]
MTVKLQNCKNQVDDNLNDEDGNNKQPGLCTRVTPQFDQFVTAIDKTSDDDPDYSYSQTPLSVEDDQSSEIHASGDEEIFNEGQQPHFRRQEELKNDSDIKYFTLNRIRALSQKSEQDLTPFVFTDPPRIVDGENNPQIGNVLRNFATAQRRNFVAIYSQFLIDQEEATQRMLDTFELIGQATADEQQTRIQNLLYRNRNFSYRHPPASAALSPRDKKLMKEDGSTIQHSRSMQRGIIRSRSL